jgi:hypothetical protein
MQITEDVFPTNMYIAKCTYCKQNNPSIISAQNYVARNALNAFDGANTDMLTDGFRYDDCHFNGAGLNRVAEMWFEVLNENATPY